MGAKIGLLAFSDGDIAPALGTYAPPDIGATDALVDRLHPGWTVERVDDSTLLDSSCPADGFVYASVTDGLTVLCGREFMDRPGAYLLGLAGGRLVVQVGMDSVSDWLSFCLWERGEVVRAVDLWPTGGVTEDVGARLDFELPFWAGDRRVTPAVDQLPFHPLDLGEEALRTLCGFTLEGSPGPVDPGEVHLRGYRVTDESPAGRAAKAREDAELAAVVRAMGPPRRFTLAADGSLVEIDAEK